jgi:hypothetical protein
MKNWIDDAENSFNSEPAEHKMTAAREAMEPHAPPSQAEGAVRPKIVERLRHFNGMLVFVML